MTAIQTASQTATHAFSGVPAATIRAAGPRMADLPVADRPRERLLAHGASTLTTTELLAVVLQTGSARESAVALAARLLATRRGVSGVARATPAELCALPGIGPSKAARILAAVELGHRAGTADCEPEAAIHTPEDVAALLGKEMERLEQEHVRVLLLDQRHRVRGVRDVCRGSVNGVTVRVAEVLRDAVREGLPALVVVHNHPSGDPTPSAEDVALTRRLEEAAAALDLDLVDHVVLGRGGRFVSLRRAGLGFRATR